MHSAYLSLESSQRNVVCPLGHLRQLRSTHFTTHVATIGSVVSQGVAIRHAPIPTTPSRADRQLFLAGAILAAKLNKRANLMLVSHLKPCRPSATDFDDDAALHALGQERQPLIDLTR